MRFTERRPGPLPLTWLASGVRHEPRNVLSSFPLVCDFVLKSAELGWTRLDMNGVYDWSKASDVAEYLMDMQVGRLRTSTSTSTDDE